MAHFNVCILVKKDGNETDDELLNKAVASVDKFNTELEVPEYKRYLDEEEVKRMSESYKTTKLEELAEKLEDWDGEKGFVENGKIYSLSTRNPDGHFDYGNILGIVPPEDREKAFLEGGETNICNAVVTLEGVWIRGPWVYSDKDEESKKLLDEWRGKIRTIFEQSKEAVSFIADCHI